MQRAKIGSKTLPQKIKHRITIGSRIPLLGIYPQKVKTRTQTDIRPPMFKAALTTVVKMCKRLSVHGQMNGWINKMCYKLTTEYFSALKGKLIAVT
jgi:hypothetical protein